MTKGEGSRPAFARWQVVAGLAFAVWAGAARADTYLIISLLADHLTVVTAAEAVGSHMETSRYQTIPLKNSDFDDFAVRTAGAVVGKARPGDKVEMLRAVDPELRKMSGSWIDAGAVNVQSLVVLVSDLFKPPSDSHLLVIAPLRAELELRTDQDLRGKGAKAAGLGFYVDGATPFQNDTGERGLGFLGVFANFQLVLVSIGERTLEGQQRAVVGTTVAASRAADKTPWNALSPAEKVSALSSLLKGEIERVLPGMLARTKP